MRFGTGPGGEKILAGRLSPVVLLRTVLAQIVLDYFQDVGEVPTPKANTEMLVAMIEQRAGEQEHAGTLKDFCTKPLGSAALQARESDRSGGRPSPLQHLLMTFEEGIEDGQVIPDNRHIAFDQRAGITHRDRSEIFARRAVADGQVVLERAHGRE